MKHIPAYVKYLAFIALSSLAFMSLFRLLLLILCSHAASEVSHSAHDIFWSLLVGLRFDCVITAYVLLVPFAILGLISFFSKPGKIVMRFIVAYFIVAYLLSVFILCADIPYFLQFGSRLTTAAFLWITNGRYILKMITGEWTFLIYVLLFVIPF